MSLEILNDERMRDAVENRDWERIKEILDSAPNVKKIVIYSHNGSMNIAVPEADEIKRYFQDRLKDGLKNYEIGLEDMGGLTLTIMRKS